MVEKMMIDSIRKKVIDNFRTEHPYSYECIKQEGRVEGAINELESLHKLINNDLNYGHLLIRKQINDLIKKRLKSLESGKE